jgi:hypothetical protein
VWRNKTAEEKERRRVFNLEKNRPPRKEERENSKEILPHPEIDACYRRLSPETREVVDNLVATGLSMEKVINGIKS